ncbi:MAG: hypothetical protein EH225_10410 [Calditrichaeota bacterium]|nr:MAG: hypothetical protein EH225_10410 [Calditrichota bacterium]
MIPGSEKTLLDILSRHQIKMRTIEKDTTLEVESYKILHVTSFIEEELEVPYVDIMTEMVSRKFARGSVIIDLRQSAGLMIPLILEPQSTYSLSKESSGRKYRLEDYLREDTEYPVYRILK